MDVFAVPIPIILQQLEPRIFPELSDFLSHFSFSLLAKMCLFLGQGISNPSAASGSPSWVPPIS